MKIFLRILDLLTIASGVLFAHFVITNLSPSQPDYVFGLFFLLITILWVIAGFYIWFSTKGFNEWSQLSVINKIIVVVTLLPTGYTILTNIIIYGIPVCALVMVIPSLLFIGIWLLKFFMSLGRW